MEDTRDGNRRIAGGDEMTRKDERWARTKRGGKWFKKQEIEQRKEAEKAKEEKK